MARTEQGSQPAYACAVMLDARGAWLWELRPRTARFAAGCLTCFGGAREANEDATACLRRELEEELGWQPPSVRPMCELWVGGWYTACFFACLHPGGRVVTRIGVPAIWAPPASFSALPLSPWHGAVAAAVLANRPRLDLSGD